LSAWGIFRHRGKVRTAAEPRLIFGPAAAANTQQNLVDRREARTGIGLAPVTRQDRAAQSRRGTHATTRQAVMVIHELSRAECAAVLQRNSLGRLGYSRFDQPYIVPIHFSFDPERNLIYGFAMLGEKVECMRRNPKVCLEVDEIDDKDHWTSVLVVGRYREIHRDPREVESRCRAEQLFKRRSEWWLPGAARLESKEPEHAIIYRISLDKVTGRRAARTGRVSGFHATA
jgi:nitroimidazol reductase NimA-like FMN-containing flavoprotein (pyridoxamine 5'-phosphate oxidase superfamily)